MVRFLIVIVFSLSIEARTSDWVPATDIDGVRTWQLRSDKRTTASLHSSKLQRQDEAKKKKFLRLIGVKDYVSVKKSDRLLIGSYTSALGEKVYFREIHTDKYQLLFTSPRPVPEHYEAKMLK